ncbi:hypothetical protein EDD66_102406 [Mobilisporobacter senegalensis]|uniref:GyrI-like small molecule binding domain-containing protein n=1 Tax=Mobilisporobacter senegalensis TaxID=1329262 RepID=A0A3N1XX20_9FIRM|nr:GyrI-like domain-containing protein [Mobilisporobacter senegalensis]ROR30751.1 hypothetical protein EDD66_102406 [Mobilisporobacter senegalensis]
MKYEWRKNEKELYLPKEKPELVQVPKQKFFMIQGEGNPNHEDFSERVRALYSMAYSVRMMPKNGFTPDGYYEYTVYPLEGLWDLSEKGRTLDKLDKEELLYTIMIRQPDFVDENVFQKAYGIAYNKKKYPLLREVTFGEIQDGLCVQMLHKGSYDDEPESFEQMIHFIKENELERTTLVHREIYLSNVNKTEPEKLKTALRYMVKKIE